jgi:hypothetical protein
VTAEWATKLTIALLAEAGFEDNQFETLAEYSMVVDLIAGNFEKVKKDGAAEVEKHLIYGFYEDQMPSYSQGPVQSEIQELATADEVNCIVRELARMRRDPHRLIWKDEAQKVCQSPGTCFEYRDQVRCGPCGMKLAAAAGVEVVTGLPDLPEVSRLTRELEAARAEISRLRAAMFGSPMKVVVGSREGTSPATRSISEKETPNG